jgi:hypothetical protein
MKISHTALAIAGVCLLAACSPKPSGQAASGSVSAPGGAAASGPDQVINFSDLPHPRAGLWQMVQDDGDGKPSTDTTCLSGKTPTVKMPKDCSQFTIKRTFLGAYVMDMNCASPDFTMVSHAEMTGDFQSKMSSNMTMTITTKAHPAAQTTKMHGEYSYVGPCAPGQTPDDEPDSGAAAAG